MTTLSLLVNSLKSETNILIVDDVCPFVNTGSRERIDLLVVNLSKKTINMIDIKCPIDGLSHFADVNANNISKYTNLKLAIGKSKPDYHIGLSTVVIGALGFVSQEFCQSLHILGIKNVNGLIKQMAISNIEASARIWFQHKTSQAHLYHSSNRNEERFVAARGVVGGSDSLLSSGLLNLSNSAANNGPLRNINDFIGGTK